LTKEVDDDGGDPMHDARPEGDTAMTDENRTDEERPRVKVTDKRRVRVDDPDLAAGSNQTGAPVENTGSGQPPIVEPGGPAVPGVAEGAEETSAPLEEARRQAAEYLDHLKRLQAEFDNYRKRVLREQTRAVEMAAEPLMRRILEVLDEFDLALMAAERKPDFEQFLHGVELVYVKLREILRQEGLEAIDAQDKPFDPNLHEALLESQAEGDQEGDPVVADVLRQGYTLRGRVIRPAGVKVAKR
jgi:molecular chaperone GrpE